MRLSRPRLLVAVLAGVPALAGGGDRPRDAVDEARRPWTARGCADEARARLRDPRHRVAEALGG